MRPRATLGWKEASFLSDAGTPFYLVGAQQGDPIISLTVTGEVSSGCLRVRRQLTVGGKKRGAGGG